MSTFRYVVLRHVGAGEPHFDVMFETKPGSALASWRAESWPLSGGDNLWSATPVSNFREELSLAFSDDEGKTWSKPTVIAHSRDSERKGSKRWISYPYVFEINPGELWITTMQGGLRVTLSEADFIPSE